MAFREQSWKKYYCQTNGFLKMEWAGPVMALPFLCAFLTVIVASQSYLRVRTCRCCRDSAPVLDLVCRIKYRSGQLNKRSHGQAEAILRMRSRSSFPEAPYPFLPGGISSLDFSYRGRLYSPVLSTPWGSAGKVPGKPRWTRRSALPPPARGLALHHAQIPRLQPPPPPKA